MSAVYEEFDAAYAVRCSDVTLCSEPRGFFTSLARAALELAEPEWLKSLAEAPGDAAKLDMVYRHTELMGALSEVLSRVQPLFRGKDARASGKRREEAMKALENGDVTKSLALASQAVLKAPMTGEMELVDGGVTLALSLWQRSAALMRARRPQAALHDLQAALKERLPAKMRPHYYWRMGHCYKGVGETTRAKVSYELAARLLPNDEEAKKQLAEDVASLNLPGDIEAAPIEALGASLTAGGKQNVPALSKLVKITEEYNKGRFAVASSAIKTGDVLLIENPYAACLLPDCYGTHCLHCFKRLDDYTQEAAAWCSKCSGVAFCSVKCRDIAISTYHPYECPFLDLFIGSGMSILSHIALRMVTQAGLETSLSIYAKYFSNHVQTVEGSALNDIEGTAKKSRLKNRKERLIRTKKGLKGYDEIIKEENEETKADETLSFSENLELKAAQIYSLCTHSHIRKPDDYLKRIVMAMFLTESLKKSGFFSKSNDDLRQKYERSICELILRNLQLLQFNAHELFETVRSKQRLAGSKALYTAVGIYPTAALFNHECYPAVSRYFEGRKIVLRALRPLTPGETVSENYGPHFLSRTLQERQRALACRYWFKCTCRPCIANWPLLKQMKGDMPVKFRCINPKCQNSFDITPDTPTVCGQCLTPMERELLQANLEAFAKCSSQYKEATKVLQSNEVEQASHLFCSTIDAFHEMALPPHQDTHRAQESLRTCFSACGNVHLVDGD